MNLSFTWTICCLAILWSACGRNEKQASLSSEIATTEQGIAFYNVENLFDTIRDYQIDDRDFLPGSALDWDSKKYLVKLQRLSSVIESLNYPVLLGMAEVENRDVLEDLIAQKNLQSAGYDIAHINSSDGRGIDCALLYRSEFFSVDKQYLVRASDPQQRDPGREQLVVEGHWKNGAKTTIAVNHWPSRREGRSESESNRISAARNLFLALYDNHDLESDHIIIMGDFNDEPSNISIRNTLQAGPMGESDDFDFVNLSYPMFSQGKGSYNYRGNWNMLDQIIVSQPFLDCSDSLCAEAALIYDNEDLMYRHPRYGLTPNRTAGGPNYYGGYSDHLPVYAPIKLPIIMP